MDIELRIDRQLAVLDAKQKAALLNKHIGPVLPGREPDEAGDLDYLRGIVRAKLEEQDRLNESGFSTLEARIDKLERRKPGVTHDEVDRVVRGIADAVGIQIAESFAELVRSRCLMSFAGVWDSEREYRRGEVVTDSSSLWIAIDKVKGSRPGKSADFKLIAKAGSA